MLKDYQYDINILPKRREDKNGITELQHIPLKVEEEWSIDSKENLLWSSQDTYFSSEFLCDSVFGEHWRNGWSIDLVHSSLNKNLIKFLLISSS